MVVVVGGGHVCRGVQIERKDIATATCLQVRESHHGATAAAVAVGFARSLRKVTRGLSLELRHFSSLEESALTLEWQTFHADNT